MNHGTHSDSHTFLGFANRERICKLHVSKMLLVLRKAHWCMTTSLSSNTLGWSFFSSALWLTSRCFDFDSRRRERMLRSSLCFKAGATWHTHLAAGSVAEHSGCLHSRLAWDCWEAWSIFDALEIKIHMKCHEKNIWIHLMGNVECRCPSPRQLVEFFFASWRIKWCWGVLLVSLKRASSLSIYATWSDEWSTSTTANWEWNSTVSFSCFIFQETHHRKLVLHKAWMIFV